MNKRFAWGAVNVITSLAIIAGGWWIIDHRQDIIDWWRLRNYTPPAEIVQLADATTMSQRARDLFYVSEPQIQDRDAFNQSCKTTTEHGKVLGCYTMQQIFLFNITDQRLAGAKEVTAAHEMLHAAYERFDVPTKDKVNALVQAQADAFKDDKKLQDLLALYQKTEPDQIKNELHSILATEYTSLSAELEAHYKQFFADRTKVVALQKAYNAEFEASQARIAAYQGQLNSLEQQFDANNAKLHTMSAAIEAERAVLNQLAQSNTDEYNRRVPSFNHQVREYNALVRSTQRLASQYNEIVAKIKNELALQSDLTQSLDSRYKPVNTQ